MKYIKCFYAVILRAGKPLGVAHGILLLSRPRFVPYLPQAMHARERRRSNNEGFSLPLKTSEFQSKKGLLQHTESLLK